jgi:hypothetical protein
MNNSQLGFYLAGLIEGDGSIWTPKTLVSPNEYICNSRIQISFHKKEIPFFENLKSIIGAGGIYNPKIGNACSYKIAKTDKLIELINLINGKFRTPKIICLHKAIDHIYIKHNINIPKLPLDNSNLMSNPWLSGFTDADGNFFIYLGGRYALNNCTNKTRLRCVFSIKQRLIDKLSGDSCLLFMEKIADLFQSKIYFTSENAIEFKVQATSKHYLTKLYFNKYPLMTSKRFNYLCYLQALDYLGKHLTNEEIIEIQALKNSMNNNRTYYDRDHLNNFYK